MIKSQAKSIRQLSVQENNKKVNPKKDDQSSKENENLSPRPTGRFYY